MVEEDLSTVQVTFPGLNGRVYDGLVEGGPFVTLHDSNKRLLVCSDIYPAQKGLKRGLTMPGLSFGMIVLQFWKS